MSFWFYSNTTTGTYQFPFNSNPEANWRLWFNSGDALYFDPGLHQDILESTTISQDTWYSMVVTAQNSGGNTNYLVYLDGSEVESGTVSGNIASVSYLQFGNEVWAFSGRIANVQPYSSALSPTQVSTLYGKGMEGSPVTSALGWWPLDGNANDMSGGGNNGVATGVTYGAP